MQIKNTQFATLGTLAPEGLLLPLLLRHALERHRVPHEGVLQGVPGVADVEGEEWGGRPPLPAAQLADLPVDLVQVQHDSCGKMCATYVLRTIMWRVTAAAVAFLTTGQLLYTSL